MRLRSDARAARRCLNIDPVCLAEGAPCTRTEQCCGFGGTFSVNFPEVSGNLGEQKARAAAATGADELVACDLSCLLHIVGRAHRTGVPLRARHLAEVLEG